MKDVKNMCELECPHCHEAWATLKFKYGSFIKAKDVTVTKGTKKVYKNGETLQCSLCGHQYTNWDVMLAISTKYEIEKTVAKNEITDVGSYTPHRRKKS
jgi:hypothetical protein